MTLSIPLPKADGTLEAFALNVPSSFTKPAEPLQSRVVFSAAHVVADPLADINPTLEIAIDWETTLAFRHHLWSHGLAIAEAMDTAQRGMGLDWQGAQQLITRSVKEAKAAGGRIACGAGTDHLQPGDGVTIEEVIHAYEEQVGFVEATGGQVILMASRALARAAKSPDDYLRVYNRILSQVRQPVILHWLGEMFDPQLKGYWGSDNHAAAMDTCLDIIREHVEKVDGIKISLLDAQKEITMRRRLPAAVKMYTGDDFNYDELIRGDEQGFSHALLGIFDPIAPAASAAIQAMDRGDLHSFQKILAPTIPLSRHIFKTPTYYYKTGVVFLAYLNGHQSHFRMIGGQESARSIIHLAEIFRLADQAGLLASPELAVQRMKTLLSLSGIY
jgi:hypothetical protein